MLLRSETKPRIDEENTLETIPEKRRSRKKLTMTVETKKNQTEQTPKLFERIYEKHFLKKKKNEKYHLFFLKKILVFMKII